MSFIVVQESLGDLLPSRTWKMLILFFFPLFFISFKKRKSRTGRVTVREQGWAESCHRKGGITAIPLTPPLVCFLLLIFPGGRVKSELLLLLCCWCLQALLPAAWLPQLFESLQSRCCLWEELAGSLQMEAKSKLLGLPWMSLDGLYCPFSFCPLGCPAFHSNTVLPPPSAGNSSECPPPGNAPDDTVCVDMGKCKDGECVPFCEREKNLRSCACNGGWCGTELKCTASALLLAECWPCCRVACWRAEFLVAEEV